MPEGLTEAEELEMLRLQKAKAQAMAKGTGVTPAQPDSPGARTGQVLQDAESFIGQTQDLEAQSLARDVQGTGFEVARNPETGDPFKRAQNADPFTLNQDPMRNLDQNDFALGASATMMQGALLGGAGEVANVFGGPGAGDFLDETRNAFAEKRPVTAAGLELFGATPALIAGGVSSAPRLAATAEGAAYGFNEPMFGGDDLTSRTLNATGGAAFGRIAGGTAASSVNVGKRLNNRLSGTQSIQDVARDDFGITLTEGQIKQDVGLQGFERDARKGAKGQDAADVAIQGFKDQERATLDAGRGLGGDRFATSNQAAGDFLSGVQGRVQTQQDAINQAYERARGFNANLSGEGAQAMPRAVVSGLDGDLLQQIEIDPDSFRQLHPNTAAALRSVQRLGEVGGERGGLPFQQLETTRKIINNAISASAQNPADRRAAMQLKGSFDKFIDTAVDQALFDADDQFITAYREARGLRAQFAEDWEANKVFKKLIESDATPEMAINFVLGGGRLAGDNQMTVLRQLKTALKDDPETIAALQEAYIKKFMRQTEKTFNPKVLRDGLDELLIGKNQSFATELLDEDQYAQLRKFRAVVDSMIPLDGTVNTSNTAAAIERARGATTDLLTGPMRSGPVRMAGRVINEMLGKYIVRTGGARARQQFNPPRGLDTRSIDSALPPGAVAPSGQVPQGPANAFAPQGPPTASGQQPRNAFAPDATDAAAATIVGGAALSGTADAQNNQELMAPEAAGVQTAQAELQAAQQRLSAVQADLDMLNDPNADPTELQRILQRRVNPDLAIDGVVGPQTLAAINGLRQELQAEIEPSRELVSEAQERLTQAQMREIYARTSSGGPAQDFLMSQMSNIGAGIGIVAGLGTRYANLRGARNKAQRIESEVNEMINTQPIARKSKTGPNSVHERAANINEVWRRGGAGENVPFRQDQKGQWLPRGNPTEPSNLFKPGNAFQQHMNVADAGWIGGGIFEAQMATQYLGNAKAELMDARNRLAEAEESGNLAAYEKALEDVQRAEMMVSIFTGAQRVGLGMAGMHGLGVLKSKYPSARPNIGAAEQEAGLVRQGIAARRGR